MAQYTRTINERNVQEDNILRLEARVPSLSNPATRPSPVGLRLMLENAEKIAENLDLVHQKVLSLNLEDEEAHKEAHRALLDRIDAFKVAVLSLMEEQRPPATSASTASTASTHQQHIKLPEISVPSFDGKYEDWPSFEDIFTHTIINHKLLGKAQKLQYLKSFTKGDANNLIKSFTATDANFDEAWNLLCTRYCNKREIIFSIVRKFLTQPACKAENASTIRNLISTTLECIRSLKVNGSPTEHWDHLLIVIIMDKMDSDTRSEWAKSLSGTTPPTFDEVIDFLEKHHRVLIARGSSGRQPASNKSSHGVKTNAHHATAGDASSCPICNESSHRIYNCSKLREMEPTQRRDTAKRLAVCYNCLSSSHKVGDCTSSSSCRTCGKKHHSFLHINSFQASKPAQSNDKSGSSNGNQLNAQANSYSSNITSSTDQGNLHFSSLTLLKTAIVYIRDRNGERHACRAFLDDGSEASFITESCAAALGLPRTAVNVHVGGIGATTAAHSKWATSFRLESAYSDKHIDASAYILSKLSGQMPSKQISQNLVQCWEHINSLQLADPKYYCSSRIDILLGADAVALAATGGDCRSSPEYPVATSTIFGWVVYGRVGDQSSSTTTHTVNVSTARIVDASNNLEEMVQRFWNVEQLPKKRVLSSDEAACEKHFEETHARCPAGRYQVCLPFKAPPTLGSSRRMAETRLYSLERRFKKYPQHHKSYQEFMKEYLELGHMEPVVPEEYGKGHYYIPHHFVLKEDSTTTKLRTVFDASAVTSSGASLNNSLLVGPTIQDDLFSLLIRFRTHPIALKADIAKMYRQFEIHPSDRDYQRILWRNDPRDPIQEYKLTTVTYGTAAAPYLATRCLNQLCKDEAHRFPSASATLQRDAYVDDLISGAQTEEEAIQLAHELIELSKSGGMSMRKWVSNNAAVLAAIPKDLREECSSLTFDDDASVKALGIIWQPSTDNFTFYSKTNPTAITKRQLLSEISKTFDPLGWLAPITIRSKILFQQLWIEKVGWDDPISDQHATEWKNLQQQHPLLAKLQIPRCVLPLSSSQIELHGFSDASEKAYAACVYLKCTAADGSIHVNLLTAKTKVAPVNQVSLPRLELCGAVLLSELMDSVVSALGSSYPMTCYTDSMIVLKWITSPSRSWKTFVANRVSAIQDVTPSSNWHHISGVENPADLASRDKTSVEDLISSSLWWHGPKWLSSSAPYSSSTTISSEDDDASLLEYRVQVKANATRTCTPFITSWVNRFSSLSKLIFATVIFQRFLKYLKQRSHQEKAITPAERMQALTRLIRLTQCSSFGIEIELLSKDKQVPVSSKLLPLAPFISEDGVLRVGGRLQKSSLPHSTKHPILLGKDHLAELIVRDTHKCHLHSGLTLTMAAVRRRYWIIGARDYCRSVIRKCITCRKVKATLMQQQMGELPAVRVCVNRAFLHSGVDFAGPFSVKTRKGRGASPDKVYFAIFICMSTKAVHLEYVSSLSTDAFIAAYRRFTSRRGIASHLYCDCGTNFVGADKELQQQLKLIETQVQEKLSHLGTTFVFNPPAAPHQGGIWEAAVKSSKYHIRRVMGATILTVEQFITMLCNVEACLNSRPLCSLSTDPNDMEALTPGHFLVGEAVTAVPDPDLTHLQSNRLGQWQLVQQLTQHFWSRWRAEYVTTLQQRQKWFRHKVNAAVGDLVLISEENVPPTFWKMGRVIEVMPGSDNLVRKVKVRYAANKGSTPVRYAETTRPIHKLSIILSSDEML